MPKYWGKQIFTPGRFPKLVKSRRRRRRRRRRKRKKIEKQLCHLMAIAPERSPQILICHIERFAYYKFKFNVNGTHCYFVCSPPSPLFDNRKHVRRGEFSGCSQQYLELKNLLTLCHAPAKLNLKSKNHNKPQPSQKSSQQPLPQPPHQHFVFWI